MKEISVEETTIRFLKSLEKGIYITQINNSETSNLINTTQRIDEALIFGNNDYLKLATDHEEMNKLISMGFIWQRYDKSAHPDNAMIFLLRRRDKCEYLSIFELEEETGEIIMQNVEDITSAEIFDKELYDISQKNEWAQEIFNAQKLDWVFYERRTKW